MRLIDAEALEEEFNWIEKVTNESSIVDKEKHKTLMEDIERIQNALTVNAIPISEGATNGDIIKAMFDVKVEDDFCKSIGIKLNDSNYVQFNKDWWNAPYKGGNDNG